MTENLDPIQTENTQMDPEAVAEAAAESVTPAVETESAAVEDEEADEETENSDRHIYTNRAEIIERLSEIAGLTTDSVKGEITYLKMLYYKLRQQETDAELKAVLEGDGNPENFTSKPDELEPRLKELLNIQKEQRAAMVEARNQEYAENLAKKKEILVKMEAIASDANDVGQQYAAFQELQKEFKEVGPVDPSEVNNLWKKYSEYNEQFYDALKINKELRDYDFRKNYEKKEALCIEAEALGQEKDVIAAFHRLQDMHEEWKGIGPVAQAVREEIWARFRAASTVVNKRHQDHFEAIKSVEAANEAGKTALCEKIEAIDFSEAASVKAWEDLTAQVLKLQEDWRKLGFANRKVNNALFERFRKSCDAFFTAKADYFKSAKEEQNANLAKKTALCEKAEALKDSTEWRKTTDIFVNMQKEWKTIGPVPRKWSNSIWDRFKAACDAFFEAKEKAVGGEKAVERDNFEKKQAIMQQLEALKADIDNATPQAVRDLMAKWNEVGHVPFKEKDKLQNAYKEIIDFFFDKLDMKGTRARINNFRQRVSGMAQEGKQGVQTERQKLMRQYERLQNDLKTYENNLGFLSANSKSGNSLLAQMERKKEDLKREIAEIVEKIKVIDNAE